MVSELPSRCFGPKMTLCFSLVHALGVPHGTDSTVPEEKRRQRKKIKNKKKTFWKLFSAFEEVLFQHQLCGALMELPSGCSCWKDPRLISFMDGTPCRRFHIHGCMYGVVEQHGGGQGDQETLVTCFVEQGKPERTGNEMRWFPRPCCLCRSRNERH